MSNKLGATSPIIHKLYWCKLTLLQISAIIGADIRKLKHDPSEMFMRMTQPIIWLLIFGQSLANAHAISTGNIPYMDYIAPGILAQSTLFVAIFYGISLIWEKDMGILHKLLVTPTPRSALVIGRALAAGIRSLIQAPVIYILCYFLGVHLRYDILAFLGVMLAVMLGAAIFSTFSLIVAAIVKKRERFMGIGQVLTMPLFFASNALYPILMMPTWIRTLSHWNPLTYQVDALRHLMIVGEHSQFGLNIDLLIGCGVFGVLVAIATYLYPKILY